MELLNDDYYMKLAIQLAAGAQGQTGINPVVGCVVVKDGRIIGMGAHLRRGEAHAEVHALNMAGAEAEGATAYVTLEPCSHYGRTPPCAERLIRDKVRRVVIAGLDPNPLVAGRGASMLREAGIEVEAGVLREEAAQLNEIFFAFIRRRRPFVTLKTASTLDGKIAARSGDSKWITNERSRAFVHTLRHRHGAIMVGVGTVLADNPMLTARTPVPALQPVRVVVDSQLRTPPTAQVLAPEEGVPQTLVLTTERAPRERRAALEAAGAAVLECGSGPRVDLALAMRMLGERDIASVLLEGGGRLNGAMLEARLIDKMHLFFAPKIIGGQDAPPNFQFAGFERMQDAYRLNRIQVETFDDDICITGYPVYPDAETGEGS